MCFELEVRLGPLTPFRVELAALMPADMLALQLSAMGDARDAPLRILGHHQETGNLYVAQKKGLLWRIVDLYVVLCNQALH